MLLFSSAGAFAQPDGAGISAHFTGGESSADGIAQVLSSKVDAGLLHELAASRTADFWINFGESPDLSPAFDMDWSERGWFVYEQLTEAARRSQADAIARLERAGASYESYWVNNSIYVKNGSLDLAAGIVALPQVAEIVPDNTVPLIEPEPGILEETIDNVAWGVADVKAPQVWDAGVTGEGIIIGSIDTGVQFDHPALVNQYRGNEGGGSFDHNYNWHDPTGMCGLSPCDNNGHGTHTVGTMVGDDGGSNKIGVAPGAQWIAAKGCEGQGCSFAALLSSMEFMLAPTDLQGRNADPDKRPHLVNNSWGGSTPNLDYQRVVQSWVAAGMFPVFANGNAGPGCGTVGSPALFPESYGVGNYTSGHSIATLSSRGPGPNPYNTTKPNISAPGTNIFSSTPGSRYGSASGTSMAAPHVAGAVALLWSATGLLGDVDTTREILDDTAIPVEDLTCGGTAEFNNVWGHGRLDVLAAFEMADEAEVGYVIGTVTDGNDGDPVEGAEIRAVQNGDVIRTATTRADGTYVLRLASGEYTIEAEKQHYAPASGEAVISEADEEVSVDLTLKTGRVGLDADSFAFELFPGGTDSAALTLTNDGGLAAEFEVSTRASRAPRTGAEPGAAGTADTGLVRNSAFDTESGTAEGLYINGEPEWAPAAAGDVIKSWNTGLSLPWGVGYDGDVYISNPGAGGGDDNNHKFTVDGEFIAKWSTRPWQGDWAGDMAYDSTHGVLWQVAVGGDNCLYGLDPEDGTQLHRICGLPWSQVSQRGVAYRAEDDTLFVAGWNENIIYHIKGLSYAEEAGRVITQHSYSPGGRGLAGLAWNHTEEVLWVATNSPDDNLYALRPDDNWARVAVIGHPEPGYNGGGLSMDEEGNLWMVSQESGKAYLIDSGIPAAPPGETWLTVDTVSGTIQPGGETAVEVSIDTVDLGPGVYEGAITVTSNSGRAPAISVPVTLKIVLSEAGWVEGVITDVNDGDPVAGAVITALDGDGDEVHVETADGSGYFRFQLLPGEYTIEASAENYGSASDTVHIAGAGGEQTVNLALPTAVGGVAPKNLVFTLGIDEKETKTFTLNNTGTKEMEWSLRVRRSSVTGASGAASSEVFGPRAGLQKDPLFRADAATTEGMYINGSPAAAPAAPGDVLLSWDTGLALPWGVAFDGHVVISNPGAGGGDDSNHKFTEEGQFAAKWSVSPWVASWAADMAYDDAHHLIWQVNVSDSSGVNCLYGLNPEDGTVLETICGSPWSDISQRGVAYRPDDDTLYVGGWNEDVIYHIKGLSHDNPGEVIEQKSFVPGSLSGLAWNDTAKVLWAATNSSDDNVYALTPDDDWAIVATVGHPEGGEYNGAGLGINDEGNLWMISQESRKAYLVDSGIPHVGTGWLDITPHHGTVNAGGSETIAVEADATGLEPGTYKAEIVITTDSGREPVLTVGVTMVVTDGTDDVILIVTEPEDGIHTNDDTITVAGSAVDAAGGDVTVTINGEDADVGADGGFEKRILLPENDGPFEITIAAANEDGAAAEVKRTVVVDRTAPVITSVKPDEDVTLEWGEELTISFTGEPGLQASYQVLVAGTGGEGLPGVAMAEVQPGRYEGTYTAPRGAAFSGAEIEVYAMDKAGNISRVTARGSLTVVPDGDAGPAPTVVIAEPADGFLTNRDAVRVTGTAAAAQGIETVIVNGREADVDADGSFTTRVILWEGSNTITVTAIATDGAETAKSITVEADWTAPGLAGLNPSADITLEWGETYTFRFESEEGLTAAYNVVAGGRHGTFITRDIPVTGTSMTEVRPGVYEAVYTAPAGVLLEKAVVQFTAADAAGNVIITTAAGELTVVETK